MPNENLYMDWAKNIITETEDKNILKRKPNIDYGKIEKYTYFSTTAERDTGVYVLLPPGYSGEQTYPVLYILHGYWDNADRMTKSELGLQNMLGNLYESNDAVKMIVVLPYIYCSKEQEFCNAMNIENSLRYDNFINDLKTDLMPFIENNFSAAKGRKNTAITGFSMGGRESLFIGIMLSDKFGYVGAVCPAPGLTPGDDLEAHPGQLEENELLFNKESPYLLLISAVSNDGAVGNSPEIYKNIFIKNNVNHIWHLINGGGHDESSVRPHLYNFIRIIFNSDYI